MLDSIMDSQKDGMDLNVPCRQRGQLGMGCLFRAWMDSLRAIRVIKIFVRLCIEIAFWIRLMQGHGGQTTTHLESAWPCPLHSHEQSTIDPTARRHDLDSSVLYDPSKRWSVEPLEIAKATERAIISVETFPLTIDWNYHRAAQDC